MTTACPSCFTPLPDDQVVFRCTGTCPQTSDPVASEYAGTNVLLTPWYRASLTGEIKVLPSSVPCRRCQSRCTQEICPTCHYDIPAGWRSSRAFTVAGRVRAAPASRCTSGSACSRSHATPSPGPAR